VSKLVQTEYGDVFIIRWDEDPDHEGGVMLEKVTRKHDDTGPEPKEAVMERASRVAEMDEEADDWIIIPKDCLLSLGRAMAEFATDWPV
jgi:hypothetical protein